MQFIGTEVMQYKIQEILPSYNRTFWISSLVRSIENKIDQDSEQRFVISDLRFVHEYNYLKNKFPNMFVIKVERQNDIQQSAHVHISEQEYKDITENYKCINKGSLADLYQQIDDIMCSFS